MQQQLKQNLTIRWHDYLLTNGYHIAKLSRSLDHVSYDHGTRYH